MSWFSSFKCRSSLPVSKSYWEVKMSQNNDFNIIVLLKLWFHTAGGSPVFTIRLYVPVSHTAYPKTPRCESSPSLVTVKNTHTPHGTLFPQCFRLRVTRFCWSRCRFGLKRGTFVGYKNTKSYRLDIKTHWQAQEEDLEHPPTHTLARLEHITDSHFIKWLSGGSS